MTGFTSIAAAAAVVTAVGCQPHRVVADPAGAAREARALAASDGVVSRRMDTLVVSVRGRAPLRFVNREISLTQSLTYRYEGVVPKTTLHVINVQYYENFDILTVDVSTGDTTHMVYIPDVSPSGRFAAAAISDMSGIGEGADAIQVWELVPRPARLVWSMQLPLPGAVGSWGLSTAGWASDSVLRLVRHVVTSNKLGADGEYPSRRMSARLVRVDTAWRLDTVPR